MDQVDRLRAALAGRYTLDREIGRGGMAHVYRAHDLQHDRDVAIKVLKPEVAAALGTERFLREIRIEARLQHPHILPLYDSGVADGFFYYVMPFVEGESLRDLIHREKQLPLSNALQITREVADALSYAHAHDVLHRDIKPGNILLSGEHAVVADFGIAKAISEADHESLTGSGIAIGTPEYMSPEQGAGDGTADRRSDIYALGCVLYEMLSGEPPFSGRSAQTILARHRQDAPPPLHSVRPGLPPAVEASVEKALAKIPADRFSTALDFVRALEGGPSTSLTLQATRVRRYRRASTWVAALAAVVAIAGAGWWMTRPRIHLDPNRVMVFPLRDTGAPPGLEGVGIDVATFIGHVLDGSAPLKWDEGRYVDASGREVTVTGNLPADEARRFARAHGAGFYVAGSILRDRDSSTVILRLYDTEGDTLVKSAGRSGSQAASLPRLGALAAGDLLPALLDPGRTVDVGALSQRSPAAISNFLRGDRAYRQMHFVDALDHYRAAAEEDSLFALAAVNGAQAASWLGRWPEAEALTALAERHAALLPPRYGEFIRGWEFFLEGAADSALVHLQRTTELAPGWSEAWMALGEVYYHLLPNRIPLDSLAESAYQEAPRLEPDFSPALYHLVELALVRGDAAHANQLAGAFRRSVRDSVQNEALLLMVNCARGQVDSSAWQAVAHRDYSVAWDAAKTLAGAPRFAQCAENAFRSVAATDSASAGYRFNALLGLYEVLLAQRRNGEAEAVLSTPDGTRFHLKRLQYLQAAAGLGFEREASDLARSQAFDLSGDSSPSLWLRGIWEAHRGSPAAAGRISAALSSRADSSRDSVDRRLAGLVSAHVFLAAGDTAEAIRRFESMTPTGNVQTIAQSLWEPLGLERLTLAKVLLLRRDFEGAIKVASTLDAPAPISFLLYRPESLRLRLRAARALGQRELITKYEARLSALGLHSTDEADPKTQQAPTK